MALFLARHNNVPAIVVKGGDAPPFMILPGVAMSNTPGTGQLTCCARATTR